MLDPTQNRGVRQRDASVRHHDDQISQAQFEARVSADTQDDDLSVEMPPLEQMLRLEQTAAFCHRRSITTGLHQNPNCQHGPAVPCFPLLHMPHPWSLCSQAIEAASSKGRS